MKVKMIIGALVLLLVVTFTFQNTSIVDIKFLFWSFAISRVLLIYLVLFAGMVIGWTINAYMHHAKKKRALKKEKEAIAAAHESAQESMTAEVSEVPSHKPE